MSHAESPSPAKASPGKAHADVQTELCLLGPRHLDETMDLVCGNGSASAGEVQIAESWRQACAEYERLSKTEGGAANQPRVRPLPKPAEPQVQAVLESPAIQKTFSTSRVSFCLVELERLIVSQYSLTKQNVERLSTTWRGRPGPRRLAEICLPAQAGQAPFRVAYQDRRQFQFVSDSHDMRFIGAQILAPEQVAGLTVEGHPQAVIALAVGSSVNVLNVVYFNQRMVLNNGHHRAYALRRAGVRFVPCLVQACDSMEEVQQAGTHEVVRNADLYFEAPRPPLLRDFDNPRLTHAFEIPRLRRSLALKFETERLLLAL